MISSSSADLGVHGKIPLPTFKKWRYPTPSEVTASVSVTISNLDYDL
jgi:hypothetical protein